MKTVGGEHISLKKRNHKFGCDTSTKISRASAIKMTDILMMPREIIFDPFSVKRRMACHMRGVTSVKSIVSIESDEPDCHHYTSGHADDMSSLAHSIGDEGLESGFASFADFLQYACQATTAAQQHQGKDRWRRRRTRGTLRRVGNVLKTTARRLQDLLYGLCGMIVFSVVNVAVAFGFLFFLIF